MSAPAVTAEVVAARVTEVRRRIERCGRDPQSVRIVAVTKGFGAVAVDAARRAGLSDIGENYAQELLAKAPSAPDVSWHFLGAVQRNKVRRLAPIVDVWEAVDRLPVAESIAAAAPGRAVMVEVNVASVPGRPGCPPGSVPDLVDGIRNLPLDLRGLMAVAPPGGSETARRTFRWLSDEATALGLAELSMGMSDDFEEAVAEGATTVRLGRVLFGPRPESETVQR